MALQIYDPSIPKWFKYVSILLLARVPKASLWASFISLNPLIRKFLFQDTLVARMKKNKSLAEVKQQLFKISNAVTCTFLYYATVENAKIPKDYCIIYLWMSFFGELNSPKSSELIQEDMADMTESKIEVSVKKPHPLFSIPSLSSLTKLYDNKEYVIYPAIYAQILSNYLTPTRYKLNHKYLSGSIKKYALNPIWINYSLSSTTISLNISHLVRNYILHNLAIVLLMGIVHFKDKLLNEYYKVQFQLVDRTKGDVIKLYLKFIWTKSNSLVNLIYLPNIIAMAGISLTSGVLTSNQSKFFLKSYMKFIGFTGAFATLYLNGLLPDKTQVEGADVGVEEANPRKLTKPFFNGVNLYLFRLILLAKWRILKENHPLFKSLSMSTWNKIETLMLSVGVYKVMGLNDFIRDNLQYARVREMRDHSLIKMINILW